MSLSAGMRLGPYEILTPLGAGGMGEVYKARDTRLDRMVAIKALPEHLSQKPHLRERFEREARAISSLSHPHICTVHDVGHQDGVDFLVMELLDGEPLSKRLGRGRLRLDQALEYAIDIADALDQAHKRGVIHRDLKPGNIMITKSGVKLLDFGVAKLLDTPSPDTANSIDAKTTPLTRPEIVLGTLQYMAPEQLESQESDARVDIFAFGAVLYEMITGRKAFEGKSRASLIVAILEHDPPALAQPPPLLDHVVRRCLAKDPDARWQSAHDLVIELKWVSEHKQADIVTPATPRKQWLAWMLAAVAVLALALTYGLRPAPEARVISFSVSLPEKTTVGNYALSPDGRFLAFVATQSGKTNLWLRPFDSPTARPLIGTEGVDSLTTPFWSPDSGYVGFFGEGKLKKVAIAGGPPHTLCDAPSGRGGTWNRDGVIVFAPLPLGGLYQVSDSGGVPQPLTSVDPNKETDSHRWPWFLPDGRHYLYLHLARTSPEKNSSVYLGSLNSKETVRIAAIISNAAWVPSRRRWLRRGHAGYLLFAQNNALMAEPFDAAGVRSTSEAFPVAEHIGTSVATLWSSFSASENGALAFGSRAADPVATRHEWLDREGKSLAVVGTEGFYTALRLSPDQKRSASSRFSAPSDIWLMDAERPGGTRFTFPEDSGVAPVWSPDGSRIIFLYSQEGSHQLYQKAVSSSGKATLLWKTREVLIPTDWSSDGKFVLCEQRPGYLENADIVVLPLDALGTRAVSEPIPFLRTSYFEGQAQFSPGIGRPRWIAYASDESGQMEVYVRPFSFGEPQNARGERTPGTGKWLVSAAGGCMPRWRRDGRELYYVGLDQKLMAVEVRSDSSGFQADTPKPLFPLPSVILNPHNILGIYHRYDVSRDGQRFLVLNDIGDPGPSTINVMLNWVAQVNR